MAITLENTLENRNAMKAQWINERAANCEDWKEHCRQWNEMVKEDINANRNEELGKLQRKIGEVASGIAKDEEYDLLLLSDVVIYKKEQFDITTQVVKKLSTIPE